jgi:hypothetical protein
MARFPNFFRPKPGRFGVQPTLVPVVVGTGGTSVAGTATTTVVVPTPRRRCFVESITINGLVAAASTGTVTAQVKKRDASAASDVNLTAATSIESDVITAANTVANVAITGTELQRIVEVGDLLKIDLVASAAVGTQPTATVVVELGFLE